MKESELKDTFQFAYTVGEFDTINKILKGIPKGDGIVKANHILDNIEKAMKENDKKMKKLVVGAKS